MAATRVRLSPLETRILERVYRSPVGFERVEDLHEAMGAEQIDFVDALETLEGDGYLSISNLGGAIVVGLHDPLIQLAASAHTPPTSHAGRVAHC